MKNNKYEPKSIEQKWQQLWEDKKLYSPDIKGAKKPFYNLMMFPYPSAEGLHVGNIYAFTGADIYGRFKRMQGNDVFEPIGLDGFGIHSENYALKVGRHPKEQAEISEKNFYRQLRSIGNGYDMERTVETYNPDYYKWTQWIFIQMFKNGLAYRKSAEVNWCPSCLTVLSDEQVIDGKCERCQSEVEKKELEQWFFKITKYAQRLLDNIEKIDWPEKIKIAQRNWIGRSEGAQVKFYLTDVPNQEDKKHFVEVFTTRPDTLYGATFIVVAPELAQKWIDLGWSAPDEVKKYIDEAKGKTDIDRIDEQKEKTGVFSGLYAINPANDKKISVWVADYVLSSYGTGAIMAVPAHDQRDFEFAKKYDLEIIPVIKDKASNEENVKMDKAFIGQGIIMGSDSWDGFHVPQDISKVISDLESRGIGKKKVNYHLRDWLISRQRYWGPPIPMIYCSICFESGKGEVDEMPGWYCEKEDNLPVRLPDVTDWKPMGTGKAPLANHPEFYETKCPNCGGDAKRETDVSDTFLDSSWYFLRYPNTDVENLPFDTDRISKWLPVDMYIGGAEHAVLHLLYSRFITMTLKDLGYLDFEEPFTKLYAHGLVIKDGNKMSKSKGNIIVPDEYIEKYGADSLRTYLMFMGPYSEGGDFRDTGIEGIFRYLKRVWNLLSEDANGQTDYKMMHKTIKGVSEDLESLRYNTAIAKLMEWYNYLVKKGAVSKEEKEVYLKLLAPFAPHLTEELWNVMGNIDSIHIEIWPEYDKNMIVEEEIIIPIQINGKRRGELKVGPNEKEDKELIENKAKEEVSKHIEGKDIRKTVYIPGKIINFVI